MSRAPCLATRSRTISGRSSTTQPRVAPAAASRKSRRNADPVDRLVDAALVAHRFARELDDRARLDVTVRADVMTHARRHRTKRLALVVPVGVDDRDRQLRPHLDHEAADVEHLLRRQREFRRAGFGRPRDRCGTRRSGRRARSSPAQPRLSARRSMFDAHTLVATPMISQLLAAGCPGPRERLGQHTLTAAALVARDFACPRC